MKFSFKLGDSNIELTRSFWLGKTQVTVNGTEVKKQREDYSYHIKQGKGKAKKMKILGAGFDGVPRVFIDGERFYIARKLYWYEYLVSCMPLVTVFMGGTIGGVTGLVATVFNLNIMRREYSYAVKLLLMLTVSVASVFIYILLSGLFLRSAD